ELDGRGEVPSGDPGENSREDVVAGSRDTELVQLRLGSVGVDGDGPGEGDDADAGSRSAAVGLGPGHDQSGKRDVAFGAAGEEIDVAAARPGAGSLDEGAGAGDDAAAATRHGDGAGRAVSPVHGVGERSVDRDQSVGPDEDVAGRLVEGPDGDGAAGLDLDRTGRRDADARRGLVVTAADAGGGDGGAGKDLERTGAQVEGSEP